MNNLANVNEVVQGIRGLLQDKYKPYRYLDDTILMGLNLAMLEGLRVRPDLFICGYGLEVPQFTAVNTDLVPVDPQFKTAFMYGAGAFVLRQDVEDVQDNRSNTFSAIFHNVLLGERPGPVQGGTPQVQQSQGQQGS